MKLLPLVLISLALPVTGFADAIAPAVKGDLVSLQGKDVKRFDDAPLAKTKYFAIYYSALWCGPCRAFTPDLVKWYNQHKPKHSEFELIFVSNDNDEKSMEEYMTKDEMPWPALKLSSGRSNKTINQYRSGGIPSLVLVDAEGKVLAHTYQDGKYVGPRQVLKEIEKTLATSTPASTATSGGTPASTKSPSGTNFDEFFKKK